MSLFFSFFYPVQTDKTRMHGLPQELTIPGRPLLLHVARVLAGLPADALGRARVVRPPGLRRIDRLADPDAGVGFGYVMNLWSFRIGEPRASSLAAAVVACLG